MIKVRENIVKHILFVFNGILAISGIALIVAGSFVLANVIEFEHFLQGRAKALPAILIVVGIMVLFVALFGCYRAVNESTPLLMGCEAFIAIIFIFELAVGISAAIYKSELKMEINDSLENTIRRSEADDIQAWDEIQMYLTCCGVTGPVDWIDFSANQTVRGSCCRPQYVDDNTKDCKQSVALYKDRYYRTGCSDRMGNKMRFCASILVGAGIGIGFLQLIGILVTCSLSSVLKIQNKKQEQGAV